MFQTLNIWLNTALVSSLQQKTSELDNGLLPDSVLQGAAKLQAKFLYQAPNFEHYLLNLTNYLAFTNPRLL